VNENLNRRNFLKAVELGATALTMPRHLFATEKGNVGKKRLNARQTVIATRSGVTRKTRCMRECCITTLLTWWRM